MAGGTPLRPALYAVPALLVLIGHVVALGRPPVAAVAGLVTACSGVIAVAMVTAAVSGRAAGPRPRVLALAGGIGLGALAGAGSGIAVLVAPEVRVDGVPLPAEIPLVTLFLVAGMYLVAILRPHQRRDLLGRLRFGLDTLGVTACLIFSSWVLLFSDGDRRGASITALVFGGGAAATVAVSGVHAIRHRAALQWCGPAAALSLIGLTALVIGLDFPGVPNAAIAAVVAGIAVNVAAGLLWYGSVRISPDVGPMPPPGSEPAASFPLLALLILGSALVTVYHLINGGGVDATSILLGTVAVAAVATREWVSAIALRRQAGHLTDQGNRLRDLMFGSADVAMVLDSNLAVRWQSPAAARQFGLSEQEVLGRTVSVLVHPDQVDTVHAHLTARMSGKDADGIVVRLRDGFGRWRETAWTISGPDPAEPGHTLVVHIRDITHLHGLEQALRQATHLDQQTGLANREGMLRAAELTPDAGAMIVIELGGLTAIGDVHGRDLAECVLVEAARRLRTAVAGADVPARLGETRFAVLTHCGAVRAHLLASQLVNALSAPYTVAGTVSHLSAWAGLTDVGDGDTEEVIRRAALALRSVRSGPPAAIEWYDAEMETRLMRRSTLEQDLPGALARGEIELRFQPIVELPGRRPAGVEVLPAWRHPTLGPVPAGELLALAEDLGNLAEIEHWVLHRSCRLLAEWRRLHPSLWLSVNVRPRELLDPAFQAGLETALENHRLPHAALVIEISEQHLSDVRDDVHQPAAGDVAAQLGRLRAQGIRTAVDDFGTGPTSLSRLRILPIDLLKIDENAFVDVAVTLGQRLGMQVVAHGVREPADLDTVLAAGCRLGQGDLLGRPMPAEHLEAVLEEHQAARRRD
ncbi:putative bifunctional diguanylate cyclase/phosphodiesterase [Actinoplanes aureus]|uniref:EAL domain-containing protein n=1 Tax=Actinoplanes aureus TaxID=2792083 RepID=A0A931CBY4_9ACTN|nr:GGDEF domain-containing phosphodiesterase [Actinoplanes aureus]MBG0563786.1 EAL domain-containing protein [Actinoplanes aureus]